MISITMGLCYLVYRKSPVGRRRKAKSIINQILRKQKDDKPKLAYPSSLLEDTEQELIQLGYSELEQVENYVQDYLQKKGAEVLDTHRISLKDNKVDWTEDLKHLEDMIHNVVSPFETYVKSAINKNGNH